MDRLLQDTLAYSRISYQDLQLEPVEVKIVLAEIIATNPDLQPPKAEIRIDLDGVVVRGNKVGITQCLANLLSNAVKFVAPGTKPFVQIWGENRGTITRIFVADNGIGVPKAAQAKIFGMFQRMHRRDEYPGTGMGLAIVRKAVQRMGGKVGVESEPGEGSRFWVELTRES